MEKKTVKNKKPVLQKTKRGPRKTVRTGKQKRVKAKLPGYPLYRDEDDIFEKGEEVNVDLGADTKVKKRSPIKNKNKFDSNLLGDETDNLNPEPNEELEHMVTDDDDSDDSNLNVDDQFDLGGED